MKDDFVYIMLKAKINILYVIIYLGVVFLSILCFIDLDMYNYKFYVWFVDNFLAKEFIIFIK